MAEFNAEYNDVTGQLKGNINLDGINSNAEVEIPEGLTHAQNGEKENTQLKQLSESLDGIFKDLSDQLLEMSGLKEKEESNPASEFLSGFDKFLKDDDEGSAFGFTDPNQTDKNALKDLPAIYGLGFALVLNKLDDILGFMENKWGGKEDSGGGKSGGGLGGLFKSLGSMGGLMQAATALLVFASALAIAETFGISERSLFLLVLFTTFVVGFSFLGKLVKKEEQTFRDMAMGSLLMSLALMVFSGAIWFAGFVAQQLINGGLLLGAIVMIGLFAVFVGAVVVLGNLVKSQTPSFLSLGQGALLLSASIIVFSLGIVIAGLAAQYIMENDLIGGSIAMFAAFIVMMVLAVVAAGVVGPALVGVALLGLGALLLSAALITFSFGLVIAGEKFKEVDEESSFQLFIFIFKIFTIAGLLFLPIILGSISLLLLSPAALLLSLSLVAFTGAVKVANTIKEGELANVLLVLGSILLVTVVLAILSYAMPYALVSSALLVAFSIVFLVALVTLSKMFEVLENNFNLEKILKASSLIGQLSIGLLVISLALILLIPSLVVAGVMSLLLAPIVSLLNIGMVALVISMNTIVGGLIEAHNKVKELESLDPDGAKGISSKLGEILKSITKEFAEIAGFGIALDGAKVAGLAGMAIAVKNIFSSFSEIFSHILTLDLSNENIDAAQEVTIMMAQVLSDIIVDVADAAEGMGPNARRSMKVVSESIGPILESLNTLIGVIDYFSDSDNIIKPNQREIIRQNIDGLINIIKNDIIEGMKGVKIGGWFGTGFPKKEEWEDLTSGVSSMKKAAKYIIDMDIVDPQSSGIVNLVSNLEYISHYNGKIKDAKKSFNEIAEILASLEKYNIDNLVSLDAALKEIDLKTGINNISIESDSMGPAISKLKESIESYKDLDILPLAKVGKLLVFLGDVECASNINWVARSFDTLIGAINSVDIANANAIANMANALMGNPMNAASLSQNGAEVISALGGEDPSEKLARIIGKWDREGVPVIGGGNVQNINNSKKEKVEEKSKNLGKKG